MFLKKSQLWLYASAAAFIFLSFPLSFFPGVSAVNTDEKSENKIPDVPYITTAAAMCAPIDTENTGKGSTEISPAGVTDKGQKIDAFFGFRSIYQTMCGRIECIAVLSASIKDTISNRKGTVMLC